MTYIFFTRQVSAVSAFFSDKLSLLILCIVDRWLYCLHKVQDYPNVGFSHAVAYEYKKNMENPQILGEVRSFNTNSASALCRISYFTGKDISTLHSSWTRCRYEFYFRQMRWCRTCVVLSTIYWPKMSGWMTQRGNQLLKRRTPCWCCWDSRVGANLALNSTTSTRM